jgi:hypothetical protein
MKKSFDCVEMKRRGAERVCQETKDLTLAKEVEYWRCKGEELRQHQDQLRRNRENGAKE